MQLGVGIFNREFTCILCNKLYTRLTGDLIVPVDETCDQCLHKLGELCGDDLTAEIARRLHANAANLGDRYQGDDRVPALARHMAQNMHH